MIGNVLFNTITIPSIVNTPVDCFLHDTIEHNPGDMVYTYAVMNVLARNENVKFIPTGYYYFKGFSHAKIDEINAMCSMFILPFANMFSNDWAWLIKRYTELIKQLKIQVCVPCVGITGANAGLNLDTVAIIKEFVNVILDHSTIIGVRGETTGRYLNTLGYIEGKHYEVIGCPTLYTYGRKLPELHFVQEYKSCAFSMNLRSPSKHWHAIDSIVSLFEKSEYVAQNHDEFYHYMFSTDMMPTRFKLNPEFDNLLKKYARENRFRFFFNLKPWRDYLSRQELYLGSRIHGAMLSILSGTPAVLIPFEDRTKELAQFHGIPMLEPDVLNDVSKIRYYLEHIDFSNLYKKQKVNFEKYMDFWHKNNIKTIFDDFSDLTITDFPLEKSLPTIFPDERFRAYTYNSICDKIAFFMARSFKWGYQKYKGILRRMNRLIKMS